MQFLILFGITAVAFLIIFTMMGIKLILKPGSEFKKNCGQLDGDSCSHCGRPEGSFCDSHDNGGCDESQSGSDAEKD